MKKKVKRHILFLFLFLFLTLTGISQGVSAANETTIDTADVVVGISYTTGTVGMRVVNVVENVGATPYSLPYVSTKAEARQALSNVDALIISGGNDIDPSFYGKKPSDKLEETNPERDLSEIMLVRAAMEMDMPVLGICRGMQILNVTQGGTLYQDILDEYENASEDLLHREPSQKKNTRHDIAIEKDSLIYDIVQSKSLNVISLHHQAIKDLGKHLTVVARSEDGIIEAIQHDKKTFILGVQFHPETAAVQNNGEHVEFFDALVKQGALYREKVLSKFSAPSFAASVLDTYHTVSIRWDSVKYATGYAVYYKDDAASDYTLLQQTEDCSVVTGILADGVQYTFKIVPYIKRNDCYYENSDYATTKVYTLKKVSLLQVEGYSDTQVRLCWEDIPGQSGYQISRSSSPTGTYTASTWKTLTDEAKIISSGSYMGRPYYYKIRAYKTVEDVKVYGPWSDVLSYTCQLPAPKTVTAELYGYNDICVSWSKVKGASGYCVYYKKGSSGSYKLLKRTTALQVKQSNLSSGTQYKYKIVPYYKSGSKYYNSIHYQTASVYTLKKLATPTMKKQSSSQILMTWEDIEGQTGYQISRSTSSTGTNIISTWASDTAESKVLKKPTDKKTRYYKIRAYKTVNGKKIYGPWSKAVKFK